MVMKIGETCVMEDTEKKPPFKNMTDGRWQKKEHYRENIYNNVVIKSYY